MKLAIYARTPLAASPWELYKALRKYTSIDVSLINQRFRYADGRYFPHHLLLGRDNGAATSALRRADLWHIHNYLDDELISLKRNHKVLAQFHSLPRQGNWDELMKFADINYTIRQPMQEREYRIPGLPNLIDPDELQPIRRTKKIKIAYAPTSKTPIGHPASKGYDQVITVLRRVALERDVEIKLIEKMSYLTNLGVKQKCHILIDDVVTGNWHRTSLEGLCFGCAVLNRVKSVPYVYTTIETLKEKLFWLIDNPQVLADYQQRGRLWVLQNWHAMDLVQNYVRAYEGVLNG